MAEHAKGQVGPPIDPWAMVMIDAQTKVLNLIGGLGSLFWAIIFAKHPEILRLFGSIPIALLGWRPAHVVLGMYAHSRLYFRMPLVQITASNLKWYARASVLAIGVCARLTVGWRSTEWIRLHVWSLIWFSMVTITILCCLIMEDGQLVMDRGLVLRQH